VLVDKRALASSIVRDGVSAGCRRVVSSLRWQRPSASCYRREVARCADVDVSLPEKLVSRTRATLATIANPNLLAQAVTTWWTRLTDAHGIHALGRDRFMSPCGKRVPSSKALWLSASCYQAKAVRRCQGDGQWLWQQKTADSSLSMS
jgi:hypothetical protein